MDSFVLEKERIIKQQKRKDMSYKEKELSLDRERKAKKRQDPSYIEQEKENYNKRKYANDIHDCIEKFHKNTSTGPTYICSCCHQTWFSENVTKVKAEEIRRLHSPFCSEDLLTGVLSVENKEWICRTCLSSIKSGKIPKLSVLNGMKWPNKPKELNLHPLEERLVSLRIPFMQIRELPRVVSIV